VLHAYQQDPTLQHRALIVLGPYMPARKRRKLFRKGKSVPWVEIIEFDNRMEELIAGAKAVVGMCGYNTYCEILSFDKPALVVPRTHPRQEQLIRARRAAALGLIDVLLPEEAADAARLASALKALPDRIPPSKAYPTLRLEGLENISTSVGRWLSQRPHVHLKVVEGGAEKFAGA
jgi:predicted glycosyltransferase